MSQQPQLPGKQSRLDCSAPKAAQLLLLAGWSDPTQKPILLRFEASMLGTGRRHLLLALIPSAVVQTF